MKYLKKLPLHIAGFIFAVGSISLNVFIPSTAYAQNCDFTFMSLNTKGFYDRCAVECTNDASGLVKKNTNYAGDIIFTQAQLIAIEANRPFYQKAATTNNIPWQMIAVIHLRETNLSRNGPDNGQGPYQILSGGYEVGEYTDEQFEKATGEAAAFIKSKSNNKDLSNIDNVKYTFFAYNGMAGVYKQQARDLGFDEAEAEIGEGSPYVMNRYDAARDTTVEPTKSNGTWGQIKTDHGAIEYPANTAHFGAFVYYSALALGDGCKRGFNGDVEAIQRDFVAYMNSHNNGYTASSGYTYQLGYNGCTTIAAWFINEYTTLTYGHGHGKSVVSNLVSRNKDKELTISDTPIPLAIYSVEGPVRAWGSSGNSWITNSDGSRELAGHVGLVVSVDESQKKATVIHTAASMANDKNKSWISTYDYPTSGVTFVHIGDYLK